MPLTFDENPHKNVRIGMILGCTISLITRAKQGWLANIINMDATL